MKGDVAEIEWSRKRSGGVGSDGDGGRRKKGKGSGEGTRWKRSQGVRNGRGC